jgi:hypothetical protein
MRKIKGYGGRIVKKIISKLLLLIAFLIDKK